MEIDQYKVSGVDRKTRKDVEWIIEAASEQNARAKAELFGAVVTVVARLDLPATSGQQADPARSVSNNYEADQALETKPRSDRKAAADDTRWPWQRLARWTYNWYMLLTLWLVTVPLWALSEWGALLHIERIERKPLPQGIFAIVFVESVVAVALMYFIIQIRARMRERADAASSLLQTVLLALIIFDTVQMILVMAFDLGIKSFIPRALGAAFCHILLLLLAMPLDNPRFAALSRFLNYFSANGVPQRFVLRVPFIGWRQRPDFDLCAPYVAQADEPRVNLSWRKLLRCIATGKVVLPVTVKVVKTAIH